MTKNIIPFLILLVTIVNPKISMAQKTITFPSKDGLTITADEYLANDTLPYIILCHQAGYSRGEYKETALEFNKLGYNCIAIDLRSGKEVNGIKNETVLAAIKANKPTTYLDTEQDILAAIDYVSAKSKKKIILLGSSYSASLVLKIGTTNDKVKAVIAFSSGEYFGNKLNLRESIKTFNKPLFVTSAKNEAAEVNLLIKEIKSPIKQQFIPTENGIHGSRALWKSTPNNNEYWKALIEFMKNVK